MGECLDSFCVIFELMTLKGYDEQTPSSHTCINHALNMQALSSINQ